MIKLKQERISEHIIKETYGIVTRRFCDRCGQTLGYLVFDCPNCDKEVKKVAPKGE